jgi:hypothetical protein
MFRTQSNQLKVETDNPLYSYDLSTPSSASPQFNYNQGTLDAIEHDHAFLTKRTPKRGSRRASSRIQSRAVRSTPSEMNSTKAKRTANVNRATDIKTSDDLSYYLERRRKNNEASKTSRAARKQKFGDMDERW